MQTKKRAKPVKFGKPKVVEPAKNEREEELHEDPVEVAEKPKTTSPKHHVEERVVHHVHEEEEEPEIQIAEEEEEKEEEVKVTTEERPREERRQTRITEEVVTQEEEVPQFEETYIPEERREVHETVEESDVSPQSSFYGAPPVIVKKKNHFGYFLIIAFVAFIVGLALITGGNYLLGDNKIAFPDFKQMLSFEKPTPTPEPTETPTPTEKPVDLKAYNIQVLNGSGVTGEAAKVKASLEAAGFKVSETGNADKDDYENTQIAAKGTVNKQYMKKLEETLEKSYKVDSSSPTSADASSAADVVITIGINTAP